jgi:hypothetical protein
MAFYKTSTGISTNSLDLHSLGGTVNNSNASPPSEFYEIEPGIVLDIILNKDHPYFPGFTLDTNRTPKDVSGKKPFSEDADFTWIGRALVRLIHSQRRVEKDDCVWALPLESNISEYPLLNELVCVTRQNGNFYYSRKINQSNYVNANPDFNAELITGGFRATPNSPIQGNRELQIDNSFAQENRYVAYQGPQSKTNFDGTNGRVGVLGRYFLFNERIRPLKRREGDMLLESRFGQSIRFASYDDDRKKDIGDPNLPDYYRTGLSYTVNGESFNAGGGNPMILIRNRQRPIAPEGKQVNNYPGTSVPPVTGTTEEKNVAGYILEDVNNDGSSIHLTCGLTENKFVTTCFKKMFGVGEEQSGFQPLGATKFSYPKLVGDQIVINSDRIVISSKSNEMFHFSKKRMAFVTDSEYTVDSQDQMVFTTNTKVVVNSPAIYLGEYNQTAEPVVLGQTLSNWLFDLCEWLKAHTHWYYHQHPDAQGGSTGNPYALQTQTPVQIAALMKLQSIINKIQSRRVFTVGGGLAPGQNGGMIKNGVSPVSINVTSGTGVPGGFHGANLRRT